MTKTDNVQSSALPERVLIVVSGRRDAEVTIALLSRAGVEAVACTSVFDLCEKMEQGAGAAILTEEVLTPPFVAEIAKLLAQQQPWSDFPIVVFGAGGPSARGDDEVTRQLGNVTFLDRPVRARSMLASVRAAIRSRRRQYQARRAIESRDAFLAMLGHELRNPLGAVSLAVTNLERKVPAAATTKELGIIARQSSHLARLVDDLLDVARITHGKVVLKRGRLNLVEIVRSAFDAHEARARDRGQSYVLDAPDPEVWIDGDRQRLEQVFANLLTNALKYTPIGGKIRVAVRAEGDAASVTVTDTGVGIVPEMLSRVFDPFAQADRTMDRTEGGIGLGLSLVRSVVDLHGGTVDASSGGANRGSSFVVRLPKLADAVPPAEASPSALEKMPQTKRVVVVEDGEDIRELLVELLRSDGHHVVSAADGPQGLEEIMTFAPDIAFVDLGLPGFDGLELARRARAQGSHARLVAVTGYGRPEDREDAGEAGFDDHLTKPVVERDLLRALMRLDEDAQGPSAALPTRRVTSR